MTSPEQPTDLRDALDGMAREQGLVLPNARLETLVRTFTDFANAFDEVWKLDPGDREPTAITFDGEVNAR